MLLLVWVFRDIPMPLVSSGVEHGNLRELALARMESLGAKCRDVRTREVGIQEIHNKVKPYEVSRPSHSLSRQVTVGQSHSLMAFSPLSQVWGLFCGTLTKQ